MHMMEEIIQNMLKGSNLTHRQMASLLEISNSVIQKSIYVKIERREVKITVPNAFHK